MELKAILEMESFDSLLMTTASLGNNPSRVAIEDVIVENGIDIPLAHTVTFTILDVNDKMFHTTYYKTIDKFGYEKLTVK